MRSLPAWTPWLAAAGLAGWGAARLAPAFGWGWVGWAGFAVFLPIAASMVVVLGLAAWGHARWPTFRARHLFVAGAVALASAVGKFVAAGEGFDFNPYGPGREPWSTLVLALMLITIGFVLAGPRKGLPHPP